MFWEHLPDLTASLPCSRCRSHKADTIPYKKSLELNLFIIHPFVFDIKVQFGNTEDCIWECRYIHLTQTQEQPFFWNLQIIIKCVSETQAYKLYTTCSPFAWRVSLLIMIPRS